MRPAMSGLWAGRRPPDCTRASQQINPFVHRGKNMIGTIVKQLLVTMLSFLLIVSAVPLDVEAQQPGYSGQGAPLTAEELQGLVAPIALYPDSLVAQVLGSASFPDQVVAANNFLHQ